MLREAVERGGQWREFARGQEHNSFVARTSSAHTPNRHHATAYTAVRAHPGPRDRHCDTTHTPTATASIHTPGQM
eukprot:6893788-Prymnesium_polylepis.1